MSVTVSNLWLSPSLPHSSLISISISLYFSYLFLPISTHLYFYCYFYLNLPICIFIFLYFYFYILLYSYLSVNVPLSLPRTIPQPKNPLYTPPTKNKHLLSFQPACSPEAAGTLKGQCRQAANKAPTAITRAGRTRSLARALHESRPRREGPSAGDCVLIIPACATFAWVNRVWRGVWRGSTQYWELRHNIWILVFLIHSDGLSLWSFRTPWSIVHC